MHFECIVHRPIGSGLSGRGHVVCVEEHNGVVLCRHEGAASGSDGYAVQHATRGALRGAARHRGGQVGDNGDTSQGVLSRSGGGGQWGHPGKY